MKKAQSLPHSGDLVRIVIFLTLDHVSHLRQFTAYFGLSFIQPQIERNELDFAIGVIVEIGFQNHMVCKMLTLFTCPQGCQTLESFDCMQARREVTHLSTRVL